MTLLDRDLSDYKGPWPAYPGMYPSLLLGSGMLLTISIWDKDVSQEQLSKDVGNIVRRKGPAMINFGTPDEIAEFIKKAQDGGASVILDTTGMTKEAQREFATAGLRHGLDMLTITTE